MKQERLIQLYVTWLSVLAMLLCALPSDTPLEPARST